LGVFSHCDDCGFLFYQSGLETTSLYFISFFLCPQKP